MATWRLVPALVSLRNEFNTLNPARDKRSDGTVGDKAHQDRPSDHNPDETGETPYEDADSTNEVHAFDADDTGPWPAPFTLMVDEVAKRHRLGLDNRLQNVIYNGRIASRSWGWTWRTYDGSNGHYEHAHFSCRYTSAQEASTRPWGLVARFAPKPPAKDDDMALKDDLIKITADTGEVIGKPANTEVSAAGLLQHTLIRAGRANLAATQALALANENQDKLDRILELLAPAPTQAPAPAPPAKAARSAPSK